MVLFVLTFLSVTTLSPLLLVQTRTDLQLAVLPFLTPQTVAGVWRDPRLLGMGLAISLPLLVILFAHEMGHYLVCRRYGVLSTVPYFLPVPIGIGTLGAFIRLKAPLRNLRELFDMGVAGPLAGFVALLPFLFYGVAHSHVGTFVETTDPNPAAYLYLPGRCLAIRLAAWPFHSWLGPGQTLDLHPVAFAAWFGLLVTGINLLPLSQLDGGHILYAALGRRWQWRLAWPLWGALALTGFLWWVWWLWCGILLLLRPRHPPVADETVPLDSKRRWIAALALLLFVLCFAPVPMRIVNLR